MIPQETIDEIFAVAKLEEVIGEFVNLKQKGANYVGLCPFHDEKTPSFYVSPVKEIFKCFGCGKAGNVVRFLMDHEKMSYPDALRYLAKKYRIEIEEDNTEEAQKERDEISSLHIVLSFAEDFYHDYLLNTDEGKRIGLEYLKNRGISSETINKFKIGFSSAERNSFSKAAIKKKFNEKHLIAAGLSIKTHDGQLIDRFRERVIFPIHSVAGRAIGFGGRILKKNPKEAKYINSPETKVYNKSQILYGLDLAKDMIRKRSEVFLVEGYTDVVALSQAGVGNVVASLGTSLTEQHTKLIKKYTDNLIFIFDGDEAGTKASLRGIDIALKNELNVKAISLPEGEDPDSFSKKNNPQELKIFIDENAEDFIFFKTKLLFDKEKDDPIKKADALRNIVKSIAFIPNHISRSIYIKNLGRKLDIDEETLYTELDRILLSKQKDEIKRAKFKSKRDEKDKISLNEKFSIQTSEEQEKGIVKLLILYGSNEYEEGISVAEKIIEHVKESEWKNPLYLEIFNDYINYYNNNNKYPEINHYLINTNIQFQDFATSFVTIKNELSQNWKTRYGKSI
ncbi:MAG: DNA primase, partial [Bacteroidota bacterium]|nr:DNA primase [Bacteroidota bacterium]